MAYIDTERDSFPTFHQKELNDYMKGWNTCLKSVLQQAPTADVVELKHGEWKIKRDDYDCEYMMCSVCKEEFYPVDEDTVDTTPNYCPKCGAKMDGGIHNG